MDIKAITLIEIFEKYGVHKSLQDSKKSTAKQKRPILHSVSSMIKSEKRTGKMEDIHEVLYPWFKQARAMSANNILIEKAKHKLEGRIKNYSGVQGHSFKA